MGDELSLTLHVNGITVQLMKQKNRQLDITN